MESSLAPLLSLFERERAAGRGLVLGVVLETVGSTYRKPGALMLIADSGEYAGLLSGGCLEGDLREHAEGVRKSSQPRVIRYDLRGPEDLLWGLGVGCEGAISILLTSVAASNDWQPLAHLTTELAAHRPTAVGIVVESEVPTSPAGTVIMLKEAATSTVQQSLAHSVSTGRVGWLDSGDSGIKLFGFPLSLPPRVLLLGAGPDAVPIVNFAALLGWKVTLVDHRPAYAKADHFPAAERVMHSRPEEIAVQIDLCAYNAAVVMSHHLPSDLEYLRVLAASDIPYLGLLGPVPRREKLLADLGAQAVRLRPRLRAPVGLLIGGRGPESVALAIVSEIHAFVHGAPILRLPSANENDWAVTRGCTT